MKVQTAPLVCLCGNKRFREIFTYTAPPKLEIKFQFNPSQSYRRKVQQCEVCGHFQSVHTMDVSKLYSGQYVSSTYGGEDGILLAFNRIISLDPSKSDNFGRVSRIREFAQKHFSDRPGIEELPSVLDVGSGLCVFLHAMKKAGWNCTALDPDERSVRHAQKTVQIKAVEGDFMIVPDLGRFDVLTFNKVLEHVEDPVGMLAKSSHHLNKNGFVYVEVPDGEAAATAGPEREEFAIDHIHIFSLTSLSLLATQAGFDVLLVERLQEPSTKYTLRAFLIPKGK